MTDRLDRAVQAAYKAFYDQGPDAPYVGELHAFADGMVTLDGDFHLPTVIEAAMAAADQEKSA